MTEPNSTPRPPARNMADIARMFLDGARPVAETGTPKRVGPKDRPTSQEPSAARSTGFSLPAKDAPSALPNPSPLARITLAIGAPSPCHLAAATHKLAQQHATSIAVLALTSGIFTIHLFGNSGAILPPVTPSSAPADLQVARALFTLRHAVPHWIIAGPEAAHPAFSRLASAVQDWLLITPPSNDHIVTAYQELKNALAISSPARPPQALLISTDLPAATTVHARLRRAALQFLSHDLPLAATAGPVGAESRPLLAIPLGDTDPVALYAALLDELCGTSPEAEAETGTPLEEEAFEDEIIEAPRPVRAAAPDPFDDDARQMSIDIDDPLDTVTSDAVDLALHADRTASASSALFDHLTNVLDPEEREALNAELFASDLPLAPAAASSAAAAHPAAPTPPSPGIAIPGLTPSCTPTAPAPSIDLQKSNSKNLSLPSLTLRALDLPGAPASLPDQWKAVAASISDLLPSAILLDAQPPMAWARHSALVLDSAGSLHVWLLHSPAASWFALREWATEHANLLALTRRELLLDPSLPVTIHLVLALGTNPAHTELAPLLRTGSPHLHLYRLHPLQWHTRRGLIVVPLS